jgi:hypothetical protein
MTIKYLQVYNLICVKYINQIGKHNENIHKAQTNYKKDMNLHILRKLSVLY